MPRLSRAGRRDRDDAGQLMLLMIGFAAVAFAVVVFAIDAGAYFLAERDLAGDADGAAVDAAQSLDRPGAYGGGVDTDAPAPLTNAGSTGVPARVARYRAALPDPAGGDDMRLAGVTPDGFTAVVTGRRTFTLPIHAFHVGQVHIVVTASSRVPTRG